ncbi:MAG: lipid-A-disaccharide synthase N-terminal domain-containing protein [Planctomycetota bacterium]
MKWEPPALMLLVAGLGIWLVVAPDSSIDRSVLRDGAITHELRIGPQRGIVEVVGEQANVTFRVIPRDGEPSPEYTRDQFEQVVGATTVDRLMTVGQNPLFRLFNITTWIGLAWVGIGLVGQIAFFGRMAVQWIASERSRASIVPPAFWYLSLIGGVFLFTYFVWRKDIVGVLGQTTGVVIYARNIRLMMKQRRREARNLANAEQDNR